MTGILSWIVAIISFGGQVTMQKVRIRVVSESLEFVPAEDFSGDGAMFNR